MISYWVYDIIVTGNIITAWKGQKVMLHSKLKRPTISTHFQSPSEGVGKCDFRATVLAGRGIELMAFQTTKEVTEAIRTL
jgi:hypothetical protein